MGEAFVNNYMMLTLRNPDSDAGTLETVLTVLLPQERADIVLKLKKLPAPSKRLSSTPKSSKTIDKDTAPLAMHVAAKVDDDENDAYEDQPATRKRCKISDSAVQKCEVMKIGPKDGSVHLAQPPPPPPQTPRITQTLADEVKYHTPITPETSGPSSQATKITDSSNIIPLDFSDEQAERVCFFWPVIDDDIEIEFVHTLGECKSFRGLLRLLEEDSEAIPSAASILGRTNMWRLTYRLGDGANKAVVARKGNEAAFDRLQTTLAQASIWENNPRAQVIIELSPLSKPAPV